MSLDNVNFERLCNHLLALCSCGYATAAVDGERKSAIDVYGDHVSRDDISRCAGFLFGGMKDFLAIQPTWSPGLTGIMQLFVLDAVQQKTGLDRL